MKLNVYSIYDSAAAVYMRPFYLNADAAAVRAFTDLATDPEHDIGRHPEDYSLARIGVWNDQNAETTPEPTETLITGLEAVASKRNNLRPTEETVQ